MKDDPKYQTPTPIVTDQMAAMIRHAAKRYVLAGGGLYLAPDDDGELDAHITNVRVRVFPRAEEDLERTLQAYVPDHKPHEELWNAAWCLYSTGASSGFLFGAQVGCELAASAFGQPVTVTIQPRAKIGRVR